jgi:kinetochore protein Mis13/DSN1
VRTRPLIPLTSPDGAAHPHRAVLAHDFHKHLDREQPEALRLRQLFTWCTSRAAAEPPDKDAPTPLPPLPAGGTEVLLKISEGLMGQLVTGRIDTAVDTSSRALPAGPRPENATNVLNRERERKFRAAVDRYVTVTLLPLCLTRAPGQSRKMRLGTRFKRTT